MLRMLPKNSGWHRTVFGPARGIFNPEMHVICGWDKLLNELHLTEEAALLAVTTNGKLGIKLRVFARREFRARYVPEDVLILLDLNRESGYGRSHSRICTKGMLTRRSDVERRRSKLLAAALGGIDVFPRGLGDV